MFQHFVEHCQEWENSTKVAAAFRIGRFEADALFNLKKKIHPTVVNELREAVNCRGMGKLLTHELIAKELLNPTFSSGMGTIEQWKEECRNGPDNELAPWSKCAVLTFQI